MLNDKERIRNKVIQIRDLIPVEVRREKDKRIYKNLTGLREYRSAASVMLFASFRSEVNTFSIIREALKDGKAVSLPRVAINRGEIKTYRIRSLEELEEGYMGIQEPPADREREVPAEEVNLILIPGVAFDARGGRLGYGGGYYDRLTGRMTARPGLIALAFEEQVIDEVPVASHDIRVNRIVTDKRVIQCRE